MKAIQAEGLAKTFRVRQKENGMKGSIKSVFHPRTEEVRAVDNVSFSVEEGEILAFIGPNGAGKSTTIKMLTGILYPDGGKVEVLGIDPVKKRRQLAYQIGTVFGQKEQLWTHLTPYDNFKFFAAIYDIPDREADARIRELGETFELHTTIFLTSHDIGDIEKLCKRIIIVNAGRIVLDDTMQNLKYHYLNKKIVEMKLQEETSLVPAQGITILKEKGCHVKLEVDTTKMRINEALAHIDAEHVEDINISNVPLENIIMEIYKGRNGGAA